MATCVIRSGIIQEPERHKLLSVRETSDNRSVLGRVWRKACEVAAIAVERIGKVMRSAVRPGAGVLSGLVSDLTRTRTELLTENALLRQQLIVLRRCAKRPKIRGRERVVIVVLAALARNWRNAMLLVKPETILRWHRAGFRVLWRRKSRTRTRCPRLAGCTIALIKRMALDNHLWGAERVRGELLKLAIRVSKRTVQKYMRLARGPQPWGQSWSTFLKNHGSEVWACDFLQTYDIFFRPIFAFFIVELGSRRVVHVGVTRSPTSAWTARQLRVLTEHVAHFNRGRPHQGIGQRVPAGTTAPLEEHSNAEPVAVPILGGLHHEHRWAA